MLELKNFTKMFGNFTALDNVSFSVDSGEILGLVGENGAGKSTLIKMLSGVYSIDRGEIFLDGKKLTIQNPIDSKEQGINIIYQDRNLIPTFSGFENIFLGKEYPKKGVGIDWTSVEKYCEGLAEENGVDLDLRKTAHDMTPPEKLLVELLRIISEDSKVIVFDEPTASLTDKERDILFNQIRKLQKGGAIIIYITHRLEEIFELTDRIAVLRNGQLVEVLRTEESDENEIVRLMSGQIKGTDVVRDVKKGEKSLEVRNLSNPHEKIFDVSLDVYEGEIVGLYGLGGSGRTETVEMIYGLRPYTAGTIKIYGEEYRGGSPHLSIKKGLNFIPEDRRRQGIVESMGVGSNITLSVLDMISGNGVIDSKKEKGTVDDMVEKLDIKASNLENPVGLLSGGNQQKVVFAKNLLSNPKIYLCDEPTQAVDVKTRHEIHALLRSAADENKSVLFISSDIEEMLNLADRIVVIKEGRIVANLDNIDLDSETLLSYCF